MFKEDERDRYRLKEKGSQVMRREIERIHYQIR